MHQVRRRRWRSGASSASSSGPSAHQPMVSPWSAHQAIRPSGHAMVPGRPSIVAYPQNRCPSESENSRKITLKVSGLWHHSRSSLILAAVCVQSSSRVRLSRPRPITPQRRYCGPRASDVHVLGNVSHPAGSGGPRHNHDQLRQNTSVPFKCSKTPQLRCINNAMAMSPSEPL